LPRLKLPTRHFEDPSDIEGIEGFYPSITPFWDACDFLWIHYWGKQLTTSTSLKITDELRLLRMTRAGDSNAAIERLESNLDVDVFTLGTFLVELPVSRRSAFDLKMLTAARDYWEKHPRQSKVGVLDDSIAGYFSIILTNHTGR